MRRATFWCVSLWLGLAIHAAASEKVQHASRQEQPKPTKTSSTAADLAASSRDKNLKDHGVPDGYRIGSGDVLQVQVWKEPDASVPAAVVRADGRITVPLIKEVEVVGLTPTDAERAISERLSKFIRGADVTVVVTAVNSKKVYIVGAAKREGPIALQYRMSILQALSEAGGLTEYAKRKKIYVLRNENGKQSRLPFNYEAVIKGEHMEQNILVQPEDTIVIPQ